MFGKFVQVTDNNWSDKNKQVHLDEPLKSAVELKASDLPPLIISTLIIPIFHECSTRGSGGPPKSYEN